MLVFCASTFYVLPEKRFKLPAKEIARETEISPSLANFVVNTKFGRKLGYLIVRKKVKKYFKEKRKQNKKPN